MSTTTLPSAPPSWEGVSAPRRALWRIEGLIYRHRYGLAVIGLCVVAVVARLLVSRGLWLDEGTSVSQTRMDFGRMLSFLRTSDQHPPLFHTLLWIDIRVFGHSDFAVRLPSMVIGTLIVPVLYGTGRELFDRRTGLIAALLGSLAPSIVWYSQEARMYPEFMLFATTLVWSHVAVVRRNSTKAWLGFTLSAAALFWTQYFGALPVAIAEMAMIYAIFRLRGTEEGKRLRNRWFRSLAGLVLLLAPLAVFTYGQIGFAAKSTAEQPNISSATNLVSSSDASAFYDAISNFVSALVGYHATTTMTHINAMWPLAMLVGFLALGRGRSRSAIYLGLLVLLPILAVSAIGIFAPKVMELRYTAGIVPALLLLTARAVAMLARRKVAMIAICGLLSALLIVALVDEQKKGGNDRVYDFRGALHQVDSIYRPGDVLLFEPYYLQPMVTQYAGKFTARPLVAGLNSVTAPKRIIVVDSLAFSDADASRTRVGEVVDRLKKDRKLVRHDQLQKIETWVFA